MNTPPLIRPLRCLLQGRLPLAASRPAQSVFRPSIVQIRANSSTPVNPTKQAETSSAFSKSAKPESASKVSTSTPESKVTEPEAAEAAPVFNPELAKQEILEAFPENDPVTPNQELLEAFEAHIEAVEAGEVVKGRRSKNGKTTPEQENAGPRLPRSVELLYLNPLKRQAKYGVPTCDLQLRSYSVPNLEFFCDFALRAAYYLGLPASGPIPLPRITERWTVPKSNFIHKKSQENFERITLRRLIQIKDGHPETVQVWLAFLQKHAYYGIGMKANVWEFSKLGVSKTMDESAKELNDLMADKWAQYMAHVKGLEGVPNLEEFIARERDRLEKASGRSS
ncbi:hypothetical protein OQA88_123 [Cercophora sp. LCS_1]